MYIVFCVSLCLLKAVLTEEILKSSLTFVIDDTGSMSDDIEEVIAGSNAIFDTVMRSNRSQIQDFILVTFNDPDAKFRVNTMDRKVFKSHLRSIDVDGGGDCPEYAMTGIEIALEKSRLGSYLFIFTDAAAKDYLLYNRVKTLAHKKQCQVVFVLTGTCGFDPDDPRQPDYQVYYDLAKTTQGQVFHLEKDEIGQILIGVEELVKSRKTTLASSTFPPGYDNKLSFDVDSKVDDVLVSVSGRNPKLNITGPDGSYPKTKNLMATSQASIVKILNTKPGVHEALVGSKTETNVLVTAGTSINFRHGFSTFKPSTIYDTASTPLPARKSFLSVKLSGEGVKLHTVNIKDMDGNILRSGTLDIQDAGEQFYKTVEPFEPPKEIFVIEIVGSDAEGRPIRRTSATPVEVQKIDVEKVVPKAPTITIDDAPKVKAEYDEPLQLKCKVNAYPQPAIIWEDVDSGAVLSTSVTVIDLPNDFINILSIDKVNKNATYKCTATNSNGRQEGVVQVETKRKHYFNILQQPKDTTIEYNTDGELTCNVDAYPVAIVTWYTNAKPVSDNEHFHITNNGSVLTIRRMQPHLAGPYICEVRNEFNRKLFNTDVKISGVARPKIDKTTKEVIYTKGMNAELNCKVIEGKPKPTVKWYFKHEKEDFFRDIGESEDGVKMKDVDTNVSGVFKCEASNVMGKDVHQINVAVRSTPRLEKLVRDMYIRKGSSVTISCKILEGNPKPDLKWMMKRLDDHRFRKIKSSTEYTKLNNVGTTASGTYRCVASNDLGTDLHEINVFVQYPPVINEDVNRIEGRLGERVILRCDVAGDPTPTVTWYKDGVPVGSTRTLHMHPDNSISIKLSIDAEGMYTCTATNELGSANRTINVLPYEPVDIAPPKLNYSFTIGSFVMLPCEATGYPEPEVSWTFYSLDSTVPPKKILAKLGRTVILTNIQIKQQGYYVCSAKNFASKHNVTYDVKVFGPPSIEVPPDQTFRAVIGDLVLRIPCKASGSPKPVVYWSRDGYNIVSESAWFDIDDDGSLIIKNVDDLSAGRYTCLAENDLGKAEQNYEVLVEKYPEDKAASSKVVIEEGASASIKCGVSHERTDEIRWYKNGEIVAYNDLSLDNVSKTDSGTYICRVSNFANARNGYTEVIIGFKPRFISEEATDIDISDGSSAYLVCDADGVPKPKVKWWRNGVLLKSANSMIHTFEMKMKDVRRYECELSNDFGKINRVFLINPKGCYIDVVKDLTDQPLLLSSSLQWLEHDTSGGFLHIPKDDYIYLSCPSQFTKFPKSNVMVTCDYDDNFKMNGKSYKYSDFKCNNKIKPTIVKTGTQCLPGINEKMHVVYDVGSKHELYEVCQDKNKNVPIYVKHEMHHTLADLDVKTNESLKGVLDLEDLYDCELQINTISSILGRWFHNDDGCCFAKRQLISPLDMFPGLPQLSTVNELIAVPQWSTCGNENWNELERRVRSLVKSVTHKLLVWTGTAQHLRLQDLSGASRAIYLRDRKGHQQAVPLYLWKVIQDPATASSLAVIQVNVPDISLAKAYKHLLCKDICGDIKWMAGPFWRDLSKGYTYCCSLNDFQRAFGFGELFENYKGILYDVSHVSGITT